MYRENINNANTWCPDVSQAAETVSLFYITSIAEAAGPTYQAPDLAYLAYHWLQSSGKSRRILIDDIRAHICPVTEIRLAARLLFEAEVSRLADEDTLNIIERWHAECRCQKIYENSDLTFQ